MRAVDIKNGTGPAESLFINPDVPVPTLQRGDLLISVHSFGLNRMDLLQREGHYPLPPRAPATLGVEFSGTVAELGEGASDDFKVGDKVLGLAYGGAYAEKLAVSEKMCIHKPDEMSWAEAAGFPEVWITATQALHTVGCFQPGERVLIHAGASGVGLAAIQLAKAHNAAAIYVTASSSAKLAFCEAAGATAGYNYKTQSFDSEILAHSAGAGVDVIIDPVGQSHWNRNLSCAARDARIVLLGLMSGAVVEQASIAPVLSKRIRIEGSTLRSRGVEYQKRLRDRVVEEAIPGIREGSMKVHVDRVMSWKDIAEAHKLMESNGTLGKIICTVD